MLSPIHNWIDVQLRIHHQFRRQSTANCKWPDINSHSLTATRARHLSAAAIVCKLCAPRAPEPINFAVKIVRPGGTHTRHAHYAEQWRAGAIELVSYSSRKQPHKRRTCARALERAGTMSDPNTTVFIVYCARRCRE